MREMILGLLAVSGVGAGVFFFPTDGFGGGASLPEGAYAMTPDEAVARLTSAPTKTGTPPFFNTEITVTITSGNTVKFNSPGGNTLCQVSITEVEGGVKPTRSCGEAAEGDAMGNASLKSQNDGFAEFVDAALDGRKFDKRKIGLKTMGTMLGSMPAMQRQALETQREVAKMEADFDRRQEVSGTDFGDGSFAEDGSGGFYD